jgi:hypothetical protein
MRERDPEMCSFGGTVAVQRFEMLIKTGARGGYAKTLADFLVVLTGFHTGAGSGSG